MKKKKHIHDKPWLDCPACVDWITSPLPRIVPYPQSPIEKKETKTSLETTTCVNMYKLQKGHTYET